VFGFVNKRFPSVFLERLVRPHIHCDDESLEDGDFVFWFNNLSSIKVKKSQGENRSKPKKQKQSGNDKTKNTTLLQRTTSWV
jgi:hypothetical protein